MTTARVKKFFWWINERHSIFLKKTAGEEWPWTKDKIMQEYKFTNVFRELDAETIKFRKRIDPLNLEPAEKLYMMILFRAFNRAETYDLIKRRGAWANHRKMRRVLHKAAARGEKIFTGAYIITNSGSTEPKIDLMCDALRVMWTGRHRIWEEMMRSPVQPPTMEHCTKVLMQYPMMGPFTSYEVICDMRYQKGMLDKAPDKKTWANLGPGARRGINRIVSGKKKPNVFRTNEEYVEFMRELLKSSRQYLGDHVWPLEMREIEHSLCEFDKWLRVKNNEGRPRSKYRRSLA